MTRLLLFLISSSLLVYTFAQLTTLWLVTAPGLCLDLETADDRQGEEATHSKLYDIFRITVT